MSVCTCAKDWRAIPKDRRITLEQPGAQIRVGNTVQRDASKVHVFDRDCAKHGYKEVTDGG